MKITVQTIKKERERKRKEKKKRNNQKQPKQLNKGDRVSVRGYI